LAYLPLPWRRVHPVVVTLLSGIATAVYGLTTYEDPTLPFAALLSLYTVAAVTCRRTAVCVALFAIPGIAAVMVLDQRDDAADWAVAFLSVGTALLLGDITRTDVEQREEAAHRAVAAERLRIARELHDVATHHVSVIAIQADAGQTVAETDATKAGRVFDDIGSAARSALGEMRRVLDLLRDGDGASLTPQPTLRELDALVDGFRTSGVPVSVDVEGEVRGLPDGVELSAYRIVQEALTNALRHAGPCTVSIRLRYQPDSLEVSVVDDGRGPARPSVNGNGLGLTGMRERVALCGGAIEAGPRQEGGFAVRATLPG
jgi:signal transduction histidine kinase